MHSWDPEQSGDSTESILLLAFTVPQKVLLDRKRRGNMCSGPLWDDQPTRDTPSESADSEGLVYSPQMGYHRH